MNSLATLRRQHLLMEFTGLKQACPYGVFMSLTPGDSMLWSGVLFIRHGPYAPAILRFQISFPDLYPELPPLVTFSTDIFHPLVSPLSTYMYSTTDVGENGTVSATDAERLPPGGFSLRHGFPEWFGRNNDRREGSLVASVGGPRPGSSSAAAGRVTPSASAVRTNDSGVHRQKCLTPTPQSAASTRPATATSNSATPRKENTSGCRKARNPPSTYDVLQYIRSTFDSKRVLDSIPLEAAGNPGAWHAWRTHRKSQGKVFKLSADAHGSRSESPAQTQGEWNWEGVWEQRVRKGISASTSDAVLFGNSASSDEVINFLNLDKDQVATIKDNLARKLGIAV